jgi:hypothetical protein
LAKAGSILSILINHVNNYMVHYVCTGGCDGVSDHPAACEMKDCLKYEMLMTVCHCTDGQHAEAFANPNHTAAEESTHQE